MKTLKYLLLAGVTAGMMLSCGGSGADRKTEMGPEDVAVAFTKAVAGGNFEEAMALCDSLAMKDYIQEQAKAWHMLEKRDSSAYGIAMAMLADARVTVEEVIKEGDARQVFYSVEFDGKTKKKALILQKEEGEWKVTAISDRN